MKHNEEFRGRPLEDDVQDLLIELETTENESKYESDSGCRDSNGYPDTITITFPDDCWQLHGWREITVPIRDILGLVSIENPDYAPYFNAIRDDFYFEYDDLYLASDIEPDINWEADRERMAQIRVALDKAKEYRSLDAGRCIE